MCRFISLPTGTSHRVSLAGDGESCVHAGIQMFLTGVASAGFSAASADQVVPAKWLKGGKGHTLPRLLEWPQQSRIAGHDGR